MKKDLALKIGKMFLIAGLIGGLVWLINYFLFYSTSCTYEVPIGESFSDGHDIFSVACYKILGQVVLQDINATALEWYLKLSPFITGVLVFALGWVKMNKMK